MKTRIIREIQYVKVFLVSVLISITTSGTCQHFWIPKTIFTATFLNKNVYKTKGVLTCTVAYRDNGKYNGLTVPNAMVGKTYSVQVAMDGRDFVRYKEVKAEGSYAYIRFLKGCVFDVRTTTSTSTPSINATVTSETVNSAPPPNSTSLSTPTLIPGPQVTLTTTSYEIRKTNTVVVSGVTTLELDNVNDYIFVVDISKIDPLKRYLASSAIIGKIVSIPAKFRKRKWDNNSTELQASFNLNYAFGWKFKIGNHPYHSHYFSIIPYAFGLGAQNYFDVLEGQLDENKKVKTTKPEAQVAFTYYCSGLVYEYDRFNIGVFIGADAMLAPYDNWGYNKQVWYGIGIGYDLFKEK